MIRKVTNENVNEVMDMCFKKFKKMESCNVPDDPDKGQYTLTPRPRLIYGVLCYDESLDDSYYLWDCNVKRYKAVPLQLELLPIMVQIFTYPNDIRRFKNGAFAWFRSKYGDTTPEWLKKERRLIV